MNAFCQSSPTRPTVQNLYLPVQPAVFTGHLLILFLFKTAYKNYGKYTSSPVSFLGTALLAGIKHHIIVVRGGSPSVSASTFHRPTK